MSVIIKSDQKSSCSLGNIYGVKGTTDFSLLLDFSRQDFIRKKDGVVTRLSLNDVVKVERASEACYTNTLGEEVLAGVNEPRVHYMEDLSATGLLIERNTTNLLTDTHNPQTQTLTLPVEAKRTLILSVKGSGSAKLSGGMIKNTNRDKATQGKPQALDVTTSSESDRIVTVTVTGNLESFQLEMASPNVGGSCDTTIVPEGVNTRLSDKVTLRGELSDLLSGEITIVCGYALRERLNPEGTVKNELRYLVLKPSISSQAAVTLDGVMGGYSNPTDTVRVYETLDTGATKASTSLVNHSGRRVTLGFSYSKLSASTLFGLGGITKSIDSEVIGQDMSVLGLGGDGYLCGVLTHLVIYPRIMSSKELEEVTKSWL